MCRQSYSCYGTVQTCFTQLCFRKEILTTDNDSKVKSLQEEYESLKKEIESWKDEFGRIATAFKSHESSCGGHKQHDSEMEKSLEFVGAEYDDLKGRYVEAKRVSKYLVKDLTFLALTYMSNTPELSRIVWDTQRSDSQEVRSRET